MPFADPAIVRLQLDRGDVGERLDYVLRRHLSLRPELSRARIQRLIHQGFVLVNGEAVRRCAQRLHAGDGLQLRLPPRTRQVRPRRPPAVPVPVLYEDNHLLAVSKAAGQLVHPSRAQPADTLLDALSSAERVDAGTTLHLVSRLDRETSGVLLIAKCGDVHAALQRAAARDEIRKDYLAVCVGWVSPARGVVDAAIGRDPGDPRRMQVTDRGGRPSETRWRRLGVLEASAEGNAGAALSLLRCELSTGRTHQIRVHLASRGWPILGDARYGIRHMPALDDGAVDEAVRALGRQALHAVALTFRHPVTDERMTVAAPLPDDLARLVRACGWTERVRATGPPVP